jgi:hypothetical protein
VAGYYAATETNAASSTSPRKIDHDRVAVGEHERAILQNGDLAKRIEL